MEEIFDLYDYKIDKSETVEKEKTVNFLVDYSKILMKEKIIDEKIVDWQKEKADLLEEYGVHIPCRMDTNSEKKDEESGEDEYFKLTLGSGNFKDKDIENNLFLINKSQINVHHHVKKKENKLLKRKRKTSEIFQIFNSINQNNISQSENVQLEIITSGSNFINNVNYDSSNKNTEGNQSLNISTPISNVRNKRAETILIINNMSNDQAFEKVVKEFLNINEFPLEPKFKLNLLKKLISIYKKIKTDKTKLNNFVKKISDKLKEPIEEIEILFEFEYLKNKREGFFANFSKLINKFTTILKMNKITDVTNISVLFENNMVKEKYLHVSNKILDYITSYKEIFNFFEKEEKENENNSLLIDKYIPSFNLSKFSSEEECKDKIIKKIKETFDKNKIIYNENLLNSILPNREIKNYNDIDDYELFGNDSKSKELSEYDKVQEIHLNKNLNENDFINNFFGNSMNFLNSPSFKELPKKRKSSNSSESKIKNPDNSDTQVNTISNKENLIMSFSNGLSKENSNSFENKLITNPKLLSQINQNYHLNYTNTEGKKFPIKSNVYLVKKFDKNDFPQDEEEVK